MKKDTMLFRDMFDNQMTTKQGYLALTQSQADVEYTAYYEDMMKVFVGLSGSFEMLSFISDEYTCDFPHMESQGNPAYLAGLVKILRIINHHIKLFPYFLPVAEIIVWGVFVVKEDSIEYEPSPTTLRSIAAYLGTKTGYTMFFNNYTAQCLQCEEIDPTVADCVENLLTEYPALLNAVVSLVSNWESGYGSKLCKTAQEFLQRMTPMFDKYADDADYRDWVLFYSLMKEYRKSTEHKLLWADLCAYYVKFRRMTALNVKERVCAMIEAAAYR